MDTPSPRDPRFSPRSQASALPRLEAMQRPSPPTEEEDVWHYDPIDPNKISPMKLKEFNAKVKSLPFYVTFEEAWDNHGLVEFFFTTSEKKEEIHQLFRKARFPLAPHGVNQPPSPPSSPPPKWYVNSISRFPLAPRPAGRGTIVPRSAKTEFRPTDVSAKVQAIRPITQYDPGTLSRGRPSKQPRQAAHDQGARAGKQSRGRATRSAYHGRCTRPTGKIDPRPAENPSAKLKPLDQAGRPLNIRPRPFRPRPKTRLSGRPSRRPSERRGRPEAVFEAQSAQFKPKAGAALARLGLAAYILRAL
ncbi:unnamed protein product [Microthlaspi erraticum]|uniref:Uncharacterized protein n=1 Tax=Microthlaspi erraticum TaxID=1685480 RepID=A0A6D2J110_9BRAS|nr:unnamed protein product [Microthlaspi erraticum]